MADRLVLGDDGTILYYQNLWGEMRHMYDLLKDSAIRPFIEEVEPPFPMTDRPPS